MQAMQVLLMQAMQVLLTLVLPMKLQQMQKTFLPSLNFMVMKQSN